MSKTKADLDLRFASQANLPVDSKVAFGWSLLLAKLRGPRPEGNEGIEELGYRRYVGGYWEAVGQLQFEFLKNQGVQPHHVLLDIACGSLRGGRFFIPYLDPGNYIAVEKEAPLVEAGRKHEVPAAVWTARKPEILITDAFEFEKLSRRPNFALAQSLFTHLEANDIELCLKKLYPVAEPGCLFFATFFETHLARLHLHKSHSHRNFRYSRAQMRRFGDHHGWQARYIGGWNHPLGQRMMLYIKPSLRSTDNFTC